MAHIVKYVKFVKLIINNSNDKNLPGFAMVFGQATGKKWVATGTKNHRRDVNPVNGHPWDLPDMRLSFKQF